MEPITAKGVNGSVEFDGQFITIKRGFGHPAGRGEKRIPARSVSAVDWKGAGLKTGLIQFTISGGNEGRSTRGSRNKDARHDENSMTFGVKHQGDFDAIRSAVETVMAGGASVVAAPAPVSTSMPPAGWMSDPQNPGQLRWWDGAQWTDHTSVPTA